MRRRSSFSTLTLLLLLTAAISFGQSLNVSHVRDYSEGFNFPTDICGNSAGEVFVLDAMNDRVVILKMSGVVAEIKPQRDTFYKAVGITLIDGDIWIADTPRSRLIRLERNGRIGQVINLSHGIEPVDLVGIADNIAVSDRVNHSISILEKSGKEKYYWGNRGNDLGEFINPGFLATAPENRLIVGDILNRRVVSYSQSGRFPQMIAKPGVEAGQIFRPKGVFVDQKDQVWIADGYTGVIQLFSISGKFVAIVKGANDKPLALSAPTGIWIDGQDRLWVVESFANKVSVWKTK
jgi:hypothetical protein